MLSSDSVRREVENGASGESADPQMAHSVAAR